jgi:excisionase family DNA binding protein
MPSLEHTPELSKHSPNDPRSDLISLVWMTTKQVATYTGTSESYWEKARAEGKGPMWSYLGRCARMHRPTLDEWLLAQGGEQSEA